MLCVLFAAAAEPRVGRRGAVRLDPSFADKGFLVKSDIGRIEVAEDARGRLLIAGGTTGQMVAARYRSNGSVDRSYGTEGVARIRLSGFGDGPAGGATVGAIAVQPDGKLLIGGSFQSAPDTGLGRSAVLARLGPNGALDRDFGDSRRQGGRQGLVTLPERQAIRAIALQGGRIVVGGTSGRGFVGRFNRDGTLDRRFGGGRLGGWLSLPPRPQGKRRYSSDAGVEGLLVGSQGRVYAAGYANANFMLARLHNDGRLDRSFGERGIVRVDAARRRACACSMGEGLARDRRGRFLVSGSVLSRPRGFHRAIGVVRFRQDGTVDRSFGRDGVTRTRVGAETWGGPLSVGPDGRILVAGSAGVTNGRYRVVVVAYEPNGTRDLSFFGDGIFEASFGARSSEASDLLIDRLGRPVIAGGASFGANRREGGQSALLARFAPLARASKPSYTATPGDPPRGRRAG